jgi:LacI family transcriptional regulator
MVKRATIADLARAAGVSVATVDRVLNRRLPVREDTVARVTEAAEAIGFHAARLLRQRMVELPRYTLGFLLQKRQNVFYQALGNALGEETRHARGIEGRPLVEFVDEIDPLVIAARLREMAARADAIGLVAVDHAAVNEAVEWAAAKGCPVFTLLTDLSAPSRAGYIAVDRHRSGRTAAWAISRLAEAPGPVGILIGSHRYLSQQISEISFRTYIREHAPAFEVLEPAVVLDDQRIAYEATARLLAAHPDLVGIYAAGGGMEGLCQALQEAPGASSIVVVCNELTPVSRAALLDGTIDLVLGTPVAAIARKTVAAMQRSLSGAASGRFEALLPADLHISESV